jgi:hypothetical protein
LIACKCRNGFAKTRQELWFNVCSNAGIVRIDTRIVLLCGGLNNAVGLIEKISDPNDFNPVLSDIFNASASQTRIVICHA